GLLEQVSVDERTFPDRAGHALASLPGVTRADDELIRRLVGAGLAALGRHAPGGDRVTAARGAAFTAAVRVVDRVHGDAADVRTAALVAGAAGLAEDLVHVVLVRHRADRGHAAVRHHAQLARVQADRGVAGVAADELSVGAGGPGDLPALQRLQLDVVDDRADRHAAQRHGVARLHVGLLGRDHLVAGLQALRGQDVGQLAVGVLDQRDERRAV